MSTKIPRRPPWRVTALALSASAALTACAVGPNFQVPDAPKVADDSHPYTPAPMPAQTASAPGVGGGAQRFVNGQDISATWWQLFHSAPLDALVQSALSQSPTVASAQAALREAQENYKAQYGSLDLPSVSAVFNAERQRVPIEETTGLPAGFTYNTFGIGLNLAYTLDVFGHNKRELESTQAAVDYQRYQVDATYLTLTSNVVTTAIEEASLRAQLQATRDVVDAESKSLDVIAKQVQLGALARSAVLQQRTLIAQTRAELPPLVKALAQTRNQLAVLAGRLPDDTNLPTFSLDSMTLPADLPVSLPSELVRQRPDVRSAEAQLHEASAQIGVATANLYPQITLSGGVSRDSLKLDKLFDTGTTGWTLLGGLTQPIFDGGSLQAQKRAAVAAYDAANANYQQTVLVAFQGVANALRAIDTDADELSVNAQAESLAKESLDLVTRQYQLGAVSYLSSLDAQRTYLQTHVALVQSQAARYADTAALFQALGGGWWNAPDALASAAPASAPATTN